MVQRSALNTRQKTIPQLGHYGTNCNRRAIIQPYIQCFVRRPAAASMTYQHFVHAHCTKQVTANADGHSIHQERRQQPRRPSFPAAGPVR